MKKGLVGLFPSAFPIYIIYYIPSVCNLYWFSFQLLSIIMGQDKIKEIIRKFTPSSLHIIFKNLTEHIIFFLMYQSHLMISVKCLRLCGFKSWPWKRPLLSGHYDLGTEGRVWGFFPLIKKGPNLSDFKRKILAIVRYLLLLPVEGSQKYRKDLISSYSTCGQIWLNHFPDDS
jgi:hypothetical protein